MEATDPAMGKWAALAVDKANLVRQCWSLVELHEVPVVTEARVDPDFLAAIDWAQRNGFDHLAKRITAAAPDEDSLQL